MWDENQLVSEAQRGSVEAFGQLVQRYQSRLFKFVFYLLGDYHDSEEIVQEAFVRAFQSVRKFRGESTFYTWLCAIAYRLARRRGKRYGRFRGESAPENPGESTGDEARKIASSGGDPSGEVLRAELVAEVQRAIQELPEKFRDVVVLVDIEGLDYQLAASVLRIPLNTVRSRLARGRARLREALSQWLPGE